MKLPTYNGTKNLRTTSAIKVIVFKNLRTAMVAVYFSDKFCRFLDKILRNFGEFFSLVLIQLFLLFLEKFANFLILQNWRGKKKTKQNKSPPWLYTKLGLCFFFFFFFFFPFQKQGLNLRTAPIIQGSIPLCNNRPTLIITKVDVLITT